MESEGIGNRIYRVFSVATPSPDSGFPFCEDNKFDCKFVLPAITDGTDDEFKNDKFPLLIMSEIRIQNIQYVLQKKDSGGVWQNQTIINDNDYGEFYPLGNWSDRPSYSGFVLYWTLVYAAFGLGDYRVEVTETLPGAAKVSYTKPICLRLWTCNLHNSVRLESYLNKKIGDIDNDREVKDFADINWYSQIRLPNSIFGYPKSTYQEEQSQYPNGEILNIQDNQEERYELLTDLLPAWVHNIVKTYFLQADSLFITDYGKNNPQEIVKKQVMRTSAYEPNWNKSNKCAFVVVEFKPTFNRLERFLC